MSLDETLTWSSCARGHVSLPLLFRIVFFLFYTRLFCFKGLYQTEGEQPGRREPVRHEDEDQSADGDGSPEYAVQTAGGLVAHQQGRGDGVGVDEAGVGALRGRLTTAAQGPAPSSVWPGFWDSHHDPVSEEDDSSAQSMDHEECRRATPQISRAAAG